MHDHSLPVKLSQIWIYPVKSLGGVRLENAQVFGEGLKYDRGWMIVDELGNFLTQRKIPQMSLLKVSMHKYGFFIHSTNDFDSPLDVCFETDSREHSQVKVWDDTLLATVVSDEANRWLSRHLNMPVRLVALPAINRRETFIGHINTTVPITFADDFPIHLISESSLGDLNTRLNQYVGIERFRPNLVVTGNLPFEEDTWRRFKIGDAIFGNISACERCVMINVNQQTGIKTTEPLRTLASYRRSERHILFGRNVICEQTGSIREGDMIYLI